MTHCDFTELYSHSPPVMVASVSKEIVRDRGGSHRTFFWAGYDGFNKGLYPPPRNGGLADTSYRAGVTYRRAVDRGTKAALPDK